MQPLARLDNLKAGTMRLRTIVVRPIIQGAKETKKPRDWIAISLSVLSLVISCLGFYFTALLQTDDVRLVIGEVPSVSADDDGSLYMHGAVKLTLVNSGNRAASILSVSAVARKLEEHEGANPQCEGEKLNFLGLGIEPFVLKPGDIISVQSKKISGFGIDPKEVNGRQAYVMNKNLYTPKANDKLLVCVLTTMVTPDDYISDSSTAVYKYTFWEEWYDLTDAFEGKKKKPEIVHVLDTRAEALFDKARPISLVGQNRWLDKLRFAFGMKR
jgi:hypothetical protein